MTPPLQSLGFIGLGVMGEPICRNLHAKSGLPISALDKDPAPLDRLTAQGVQASRTTQGVLNNSDVIFLSLPSGEVVHQLAHAEDGLLNNIRPNQIVIDLSTSPVHTTRALAAEFDKRGAHFIDAPVARTRAAAEAGTLSVMVGATEQLFAHIKPLLETFATDITLCGPVGCGQVVKILNNMVLFETVAALCEAKAIGERAGVDATLLFDTLAKGSADSFALRNHGMKAMLKNDFPERAFSVEYARKDLMYALRLALDTGVDAPGARTVDDWYAQAIEAGLGGKYHPVISQLIGR